jgi:Ca-activated chloride channel homolog
VTFAWPLALVFLLTVPAVLGAYVVVMRRRRRQAITYSSLALLRTAIPSRSRWVRHLPVAALLACLGVLALASARPEITTNVPTEKTSVILALDESGSMCSTDLLPNRLSVAQKAALHYVDSEPSDTQIGLVLFSAFAELAVPPTRDHSLLDRALDNLSTAPGTAIGAAILQSLDAIAEVDPQVQPVARAVLGASATPSALGGPGGESGGATSSVGTAASKAGNHGYTPDVIVLLTDGANNRGITPLQAAPFAIARHVRIYTIGYGTTQPGPLSCTPQQQGGFGGGFGGGSFGGPSFSGGGFGGGFGGSPLVADLPPLREVSRLTGGASYTARDASQLTKVFANLPDRIATQKQHEEVTAEFVVAGALLALAALAASLRWGAHP